MVESGRLTAWEDFDFTNDDEEVMEIRRGESSALGEKVDLGKTWFASWAIRRRWRSFRSHCRFHFPCFLLAALALLILRICSYHRKLIRFVTVVQ